MNSQKTCYRPDASWRQLTPGGVILDPGTSAEFFTGDWRSQRPVWNEQNCRNCLLCWPVCPDMSVLVKDGKMVGIDYDHCKGCGLCAHACKFSAIEMHDEGDAQ